MAAQYAEHAAMLEAQLLARSRGAMLPQISSFEGGHKGKARHKHSHGAAPDTSGKRYSSSGVFAHVCHTTEGGAGPSVSTVYKHA